VQARKAPKAIFPLVIDRPADGAADTEEFLTAAKAEREAILSKLRSVGAVVFRGFPKLSIPEIARFARDLAGTELLSYVAGASPRTQLGGGVYTSTEYPVEIDLPLHNELSYTFEWPEFLFFYCVTPASAGGETPLADSREILRRLDPQIVERFKARGLRYERLLEDGPGNEYSWQAAFETRDRSMVEAYCERGNVDFRWNDDGSLWLSEIRPATAIHPATGEEVWFNQADGFHPSTFGEQFHREYSANPAAHRLRLNVRFADGGDINHAELDHIRAVTSDLAVPVAWREGDIAVVDNMG
jgi:hypothetical protein